MGGRCRKVGRVIEMYFVFAGQSGNSAGAAEHLFVSSISPMNKANLVFGSFQLVLAEPVLQKRSLLARMFGVVDVYNKNTKPFFQRSGVIIAFFLCSNQVSREASERVEVAR